MTPDDIATRLRAISLDMINLGVEMAYYGGLSEIAQHGKELVGAGHLASEWAEMIEAGAAGGNTGSGHPGRLETA